MKPAAFLLLLLVILAFLSGCTAPAPLKEIAPGETLAPPYTDLSDLALQKADIAFAAVDEEQDAAGTPAAGLPAPSGAARSHAAVYRSLSPQEELSQAIWEYADEASGVKQYQALKDAADALALKPAGTTKIISHPDPVVGHRSFAYTVYTPGNPSDPPETVLVFSKFRVLEVLRLKNATLDLVLLEKEADRAAAKIPGGRVRYVAARDTPAPAPSGARTDYSTVDEAPPLQAAAVSDGAIGRLQFGLTLRPGKEPEDLKKMSFHLYANKGRRSSGLVKGSDPAVQIGWQKTGGWPDSVLGEGETATISLDLAAMNFTLTPEEMNSGVIVYPSGFGTPTSDFTWCKNFPAVLVNGTVYEC